MGEEKEGGGGRKVDQAGWGSHEHDVGRGDDKTLWDVACVSHVLGHRPRRARELDVAAW